MPMRPHRTRNNNDKEKCGDDSSDGVEDNHGHSRTWTRTQRVLRLIVCTGIATSILTPLTHRNTHGVFGRQIHVLRRIQHHLTLLCTRHTKDTEILHRGGHRHIITVVCISTVQNNGHDVVLVVRVLESFGSINVPGVIRRITAYVGDVFDGEVGERRGGRVVEVPC